MHDFVGLSCCMHKFTETLGAHPFCEPLEERIDSVNLLGVHIDSVNPHLVRINSVNLQLERTTFVHPQLARTTFCASSARTHLFLCILSSYVPPFVHPQLVRIDLSDPSSVTVSTSFAVYALKMYTSSDQQLVSTTNLMEGCFTRCISTPCSHK